MSDEPSLAENADASPPYDNAEEENSPLCALLPKNETQCQSFLKKHSLFDGRNITIAILDTGVDPAAPGLQITCTGAPKILDLIDCTGSGDVDTSVVRTVNEDGYLTGLTGRKLKIPEEWSNPNGKYHLGLKNIYELYPKRLKERLIKERREKLWSPMHRLATADVTRQMEKFESTVGTNPTELDEKWKKEDLAALSGQINELDTAYEDCGPIMDCIVFHDGKMWKACVDTTFSGNLKRCKILSSFRETKDYAHFTSRDLLTYSVNFYDNGDLLQIVANSGAHGTHVASIAAAYFPDDEDRNGLAPGAQILSLCIGDNRLNGMETGTALTRAINLCIEAKVDIINYSFAEDAHFFEYGPICKAIEEAVYKHDIAFVTCASNDGPALSSVSCPGGRLDACISVGAYVSTTMMQELYSIRRKLPLSMFSWSSRGPAPDGGLGVSICAPGAAFTSVPNWTLKYSQLLNGTSMSSPNAAGCVACLISGLKYENILYSPISVKRALENTAKRVEDFEYLSTGQGLVQIDDVFDFMMSNYRYLDSGIRYKVKCGNYRGIYIREMYDLELNKERTVSVEPIFKEDIDCEEKVRFEKRFKLECKESWIDIPKNFNIAHNQKSFTVEIDISSLKVNSLNFAQILAFDEQHPEIGPLWRFPITVIVPERLSSANRYSITVDKILFKPAIAYRHFISVPDGAGWASMKFRCNDPDNQNQFAFHAMQLYPDKSRSSSESYKMTLLPKNGETVAHFPVLGNRTLELCLSKWWSSVGDVYGSFEINFRGLTPLCPSVNMLSSDGVQRLYFQSKLLYEEAEPVVSLTSLCKPIKPSKSKIGVLGPRDLFRDGYQIYRSICDYDFNVNSSCEITPIFPSICDYLYENQFGCFLWMIFTKSKEYVCAGGAYPSRYCKKLEKGDYVLSLQLRHDDKNLLEKFKDMTLVIKYRLKKAISIDCYASWANYVQKSKKFGSQLIPTGQSVPLYFDSLTSDKLPKESSIGCFLEGHLTLSKYEPAKLTSKFDFRYIISDSTTKQTSKKDEEDGEETSLTTKYEHAIRNLKINWLSRFDKEESKILYESLKKDNDDYLPLHLSRIKALTEQGYDSNKEKIIEIAGHIIDKIDQKRILEYFGSKENISCDADKIKKDMTKKRSHLVDALIAKGLAIADLVLEKFDSDTIPSSLLKFISSENMGDAVIDKLDENRSKSAFMRGASDDEESYTLEKRTNLSCSGKKSAAKEGIEPSRSSVLERSDLSKTNERESLTTLDAKNTSDFANLNGLSSLEEHTLLIDSSINDLSGNDSARKYTTEDLNKIFVDLAKFCDMNDPKVFMFGIKCAIAHQHYGRALKYLKNGLSEKSTKERDILFIEIYEKLGWMHVVDHLRNWLLVKYPPSRRPF